MSAFTRSSRLTVDGPPPIAVRYFYTSTATIDDPLARVAPPTATAAAVTKTPPTPFSEHDSAALDDAWNKLNSRINKFKKDLETEKRKRLHERRTTPNVSPALRARSRPVSRAGRESSDSKTLRSTPASLMHDEASSLLQGSSQELRKRAFSLAKPADDTDHSSSRSSREYTRDPLKTPDSLRPANSPLIGPETDSDHVLQGTTGTPFIRAPARSTLSQPWQGSFESQEDALGISPGKSPSVDMDRDVKHLSLDDDNLPTKLSTKIPVGVSQLQQVLLPQLQMHPIYWSPVNDIATVARGTWFYKDSMLPVEPDVANMLEAGYVQLRAWTATWKDELNSAIEVGSEGEEKIAYTLWPDHIMKRPQSRPGSSLSNNLKDNQQDTPESRRYEAHLAANDIIDASSASTNTDHKAAGTASYGMDGQQRMYRQTKVIYANEKEAYILRTSLQPSAYYGRRPLANYIRKDHNIGIKVIRGFDQEVWNEVLGRTNPKAARTQTRSTKSFSIAPIPIEPTLKSDEVPVPRATTKVTDLVLVIHGIGQKYSERVESYHFTHSMNTFRREFNVELQNQGVKPHLRKDMGEIMVLPVNWRASLSFEDGGFSDGPDSSTTNHFSLDDITPNSLASVRNIISDVMLDIPYYLSHHQPRMIAAVIKEANHIYQLWCENNPGFEQNGRVHLIAHSLGSVMAIDILSKQPTQLEGKLQNRSKPDFPHFNFNVSNLFVCGSPAGFFLLLRKAVLLPRRGTDKANQEDTSLDLFGSQCEYGCLAVENIYNIINPYDPVAYHLNATVDAAYAASLKPALVPAATGSWFRNPFKGSTMSYAKSSAAAPSSSRPVQTQRLPSNVELETHNFSREEIAEKRAHLLNDNGQIDFLLRYGGGPLEIQYLTMLGAHSSYWLSRDFVRFVVVETGRKAGRGGTLPVLRAVKKKALGP